AIFFGSALSTGLSLALDLFLFFFLPFRSSGKRMPSVFFGRSMTWPRDALTVYSRPKYLLIVFAFAGDSTMTSERAMLLLELRNVLQEGLTVRRVSLSLSYV